MLVVGGGAIALRKTQLVVAAGAKPKVVAPVVDVQLRALVEGSGGVVELRTFRDADVSGHMLVIAATDDDSVNVRVHQAATAAGVLINTVDDQARSTAVFPAIVDRDPITVAISTAGQSPTLATTIRAWIEVLLHPRIGMLASFLGDNRARIRAAVPEDAARRAFLRDIVEGPIAEQVYQGHTTGAQSELERNLEQTTRASTGFVSLVGAGPGDPDLLTIKALRCLQRADHILYDNLVGEGVLDLARRDARKTYVGKRAGLDPNRQTAINRMLVDEARAGHRVVRLKGGDPFIFGRGGEEIETLVDEGIAFEVVPGITAALGCAAYAGIPLTHRDHAQSVRFVTGHRSDGSVNLDWPELARADQTLVFYMGLPGLAEICTQLVAHGLDRSTPAALIARGTLPDQHVVVASIESLADVVASERIHGPTIIIIGRVVALRERLRARGSS